MQPCMLCACGAWVSPRTAGSFRHVACEAEADVLPVELTNHLQAMVGFRNIAVHDYRKLNIEIVRSIIQKRLGGFREFSRIILELALLPSIKG